jgi:hypothetical protein
MLIKSIKIDRVIYLRNRWGNKVNENYFIPTIANSINCNL